MLYKFFSRKNTSTHPKNAFPEKSNVSLVHAGKEFFTVLKKMIDEAESCIHLQTYIFGDDDTGKFVANALKNAVKRNVAVHLLVDGFASQSLSKEFVHELKEAGIHFRFFEPLLRSKHFYFGRRLHHKVVVVDKRKALVGSMNIADRYNDLPGSRAWLDMALYIEGSACEKLDNICWDLWDKKQISPTRDETEKRSSGKMHNVALRIRRNDWVRSKQDITKTYKAFFRVAEKDISIVCSYFLPGRTIRALLKQAASRGVNVKIVLAQKSDVKTAKNAERYLYRWLLRSNIKVYEYKPAVLHAKFVIVDEHLLTLGSCNLNQLSAYASIELNIDIKDEPFAAALQKEVNMLIDKDCERIDLSSYNTPLFSFKQLVQWSSYIFLRVLLAVFTFYYRQGE